MQYHPSSQADASWAAYWFEKNLQGDVVAIYDDDGNKLISYVYDAWGNFTPPEASEDIPSVVTNNPFTYRGYYYDYDLGLYYLQSRYYDSNTGRFISADSYVNANGDIVGFNMYAYCSNNPVMFTDETGEGLIITAIIISALVGAAIEFVLDYIPDVVEEIDDGFEWNDFAEPFKENGKEYAISALRGLTTGAAYGTGLGIGATAFLSGTMVSAGTAIAGALFAHSQGALVGMGIYALESNVFGDKEYRVNDMICAGIDMGSQSVRQYSAGLFTGNIGAYTELTFVKSIIVRFLLKLPFVVEP